MINSGNKKIALVTGATGYLGKQICSDLIREGYFVVLSDLNFDELTEFQASIQPELRVYTSILPINLSNIDDILVQSKNLCSKLPRLDLIVNNAAMTGKSAPENYMSSLENQDEFLFLEGLKINLLAPFAIIKTYCQLCKRQRCKYNKYLFNLWPGRQYQGNLHRFKSWNTGDLCGFKRWFSAINKIFSNDAFSRNKSKWCCTRRNRTKSRPRVYQEVQ